MPDRSSPSAAALTAPPTSFADIVRVLAVLPPLPPVPDDFKTAVYADPHLTQFGTQRDALIWLGQGQRRFSPQLGAIGRVDIAYFVGPHGQSSVDWAALLLPWHEGTHASVQALASDPALDLELYELADAPITDSRLGPALTETQAAHAMAYGMLAVKPEASLLLLSTIADTQTGADASALAVIAALSRQEATIFDMPEALTATAARAQAANRASLTDPLTILAALGGHESCAIMGAIVAARLAATPVLLEGWPALAAALTLAKLAGSPVAARDFLGHACATCIPAVALQSQFGTALQTLLDFALPVPAGDGQQGISVLPVLRSLSV